MMSTNSDIALSDMDSTEDKLPLHEDIMQLARLGEISSIQKLFDDGKFNAHHKDKEGITPLHVCRTGLLSRILLIPAI